MEIVMEKSIYGYILNKPDVMIDIDRTGLSPIHCEIIDFCLHTCQTEIVFSENKSYKDYLEFEFEIGLDDFMEKIKGDKYILKDNKWLEGKLKELSKTLITTRSKYNFSAQVILPKISVDFENKNISFLLSADMLKIMFGIKNISLGNENNQLTYTSYNYVNVNMYSLTNSGRGLYENLLKAMWSLYKFRKNSLKCSIEEFLCLVGIDSSNTTYIKKKVLNLKEEISKKTNMEIIIDYEFGKYNKPKNILIKIDFEKSKNNKEFIAFLEKNKDLEIHEYKKKETEPVSNGFDGYLKNKNITMDDFDYENLF